MEEKKYLKWYNKVGYGSGDIAGNVVFAFLSSFIMIYLTNTVGLNAGVIGSLIAASKVLDGISDVVFGSMIDRTHTKMGKARPWMLGAYFGCAITLIAAFSVPTTMGKTSQYVWFFITYLLLNAGFYTANNIAYSTLTALITRKSTNGINSIHVCIWNKLYYSDYYCWIGSETWWRSRRMENNCNYLCNYRFNFKYIDCIFS